MYGKVCQYDIGEASCWTTVVNGCMCIVVRNMGNGMYVA